MRHYYVLNQDPQSARVFEFIQAHRLDHTVHINRTRFWVPEPSIILTECMLRFQWVVSDMYFHTPYLTGVSFLANE